MARQRRRRQNPEDEEDERPRRKKKRPPIDWRTFALSAVAGGALGTVGAYAANKILTKREREQDELRRREAERLARMLSAAEARAIGPVSEQVVATPEITLDEILFEEDL